MEQIHQSLVRAGFGDSIFFTSDGPRLLYIDALPGILPVINFGPGKALGLMRSGSWAFSIWRRRLGNSISTSRDDGRILGWVV